MLYLALFCIVTFIFFEYFENVYKQSKYYKNDVVSISYLGNSFDTKDDLKIKEV